MPVTNSKVCFSKIGCRCLSHLTCKIGEHLLVPFLPKNLTMQNMQVPVGIKSEFADSSPTLLYM